MSDGPAEKQIVVLEGADLSDWWWNRWFLFNGLLGFIGIGSVFAMEFLMGAVLPEGEDAVEPFALLFGIIVYAVTANCIYFSSMLKERRTRDSDPVRARSEGIQAYGNIMRVGCLLTSIPLWYGLIFWLGHRK
jgi:hypothetical protein